MKHIGKFLQWKRRDGVAICQVSDLLEKSFDANWLADEFVRLNRDVWEEITDSQYLWTPEMVRNHFRLCPDLLYCAFENGVLVGTLTNMRTTEQDMRKNKTWLEKTGKGFLNTHRPHGDIGLGVDLSVSKKASPKVADRIVRAALLTSVLGEGVKAVYLGARIPGYQKHSDMTVNEYVFGKRKNGKPFDPELYFYLKNGFEIVEIIPEYMDDEKSLNYGVLIKWTNPIYKTTRAVPFLGPVIKTLGKAVFLRVP